MDYMYAYAYEAANKAYWHIDYARKYFESICRDLGDPDACELERDLQQAENMAQRLVEKYYHQI